MNDLVMIFTDHTGMIVDEPLWHLVDMIAGEPSTICTMQPVSTQIYRQMLIDEKSVKRGGITCPDCLAVVKHMKAVKL